MPYRLLAAIALLACGLAPAAAQTVDQDVRCVLAGNAFGLTEKDAGKKQLALATALFFAGRVDARLAPGQLRAQVLTQGKALGTANMAETMTACARTFQTKQRAMQAIGEQVARSQQGKK